MITSFKMALRSISGNKLRAMLTMLGIIIGVMALVVLVSLVDGAAGSVTDAVEALGSDVVTVSISDDKGAPIKLADLDRWTDELPEISLMAPYANTTGTGKYGDESDAFSIYGVTPAYYQVQSMKLLMGRFLKASDVDNHTRVCVINYDAADRLVGYLDCVGQEISLNGVKYTIVGVLDKDETLMSAILSGVYIAYVPYTSLVRLADSVSPDITSFYAAAAEGTAMSVAGEAMKNVLFERFEQDDDAYSVSSTDIMEEAMSSITGVLSILLGGIAAISLVVGGIGIMNIMLVTVTERTREIGIRKAIGATRATILSQFLMEAVVLCMLGCAIGIFLSWSFLRMLGVVVSSLPLTFSLDGTVVLLSVIFCFIIGVVFGLYPANKAAKMKPIDALHYGG